MKKNAYKAISRSTLLLGSLLFVIAIGCSTGDKSEQNGDADIKVIHIESPWSDSTIFLSSLVSDVSVLPLEYNEASMLGEVVKLKIHDDKIYVQDKHKSSLSVFDITGRFLNQIGRQGRGPTEYINIRDFDVNESTGHVLIYDDYTRKIFQFLSDGTFIKEVQMPFAASQIAVRDDLVYMYRFNPSQFSDFSLNIYDTLGNVKRQYFESDPREMGILNKTVFGGSSYDDKIPFQEVLNTHIYTLEKGKLRPVYKVDFGKHNLTDEARRKILDDPMSQDEIMNGSIHMVASVHHVHFLKDYLMFTYEYNRIAHRVFYHYKTDKVINSYSVFDDISFLYFRNPMTQNKDKLVGVYYPHDIPYNISFIEGAMESGLPTPVSDQGKRSLEMLRAAEENISKSNPYLLIYTLK